MNNMVIIMVALVLAGSIALIVRKVKQDKERLEFLINGTQFEANIVGVAPLTPSPETEPTGQIKVKISYIHPFSRKEITENRVLSRRDYKDDRLINVTTCVTDSEGYSVLTPPVPAEAYLLNCEVMFIQKTKFQPSIMHNEISSLALEDVP